MADMFPDKYVHIGGDEVKYGCWAESASINAFMKEKGIADGDYYALEQWFFSEVDAMVVGELGRKTVAWEEVFFSDAGNGGGAHGAWVGSDALPRESTVIEIWTGADYLATALDQGYDGLMAYGWYLDRQNPVDDVGMWFWGDTWGQMYAIEPEPMGPQPEVTADGRPRGRALGGDASIWTEMTDEGGLDVAVWPRAAAVGERLWSPRAVKAANHAAPRLSAWRCRLASRYGIRAHPIWSDSCSAVDGVM
jgi:hexosaminidase